MGVVAVLETVEDMTGYGPHPAHREYQFRSRLRVVNADVGRVHELREQITEDTLAFDMPF